MTEEEPSSPPEADSGGAGAGARTGGGAGGMESMTPEQVRATTLMLRKPTVVDQLQESVPLPPGAVPRDGLPFWARVPLGSKLPVINHPKDAFVFYRDKLGQGLWRSSELGEFRLDDPNMHEVDYSYDAVHDPHLARMFRAGEFRQILLDRGFILPTEEAVCTLRQFNAYRRYLHTIYRELIKEEYQKRSVDLSDEQAIRRARQCEDRQLEMDEKRMEREQKQGELRQHLEEERRKKQQQLMVRQLHYMELLARLETRREEQRLETAERAREADEKVRHNQAVAAEIQRAKVIATIQAWSREERERTTRLEKQQLQLQEYKEKKVEEQWMAKIQVQQEREELERRLLARQEEALRLAVELRNKKVEREDLRMQALLKKIKTDADKQRARRMRFRPAKRKRPGRSMSSNLKRRRRRVNSAGFIADEGDMTSTDRMFNVSMRIVKTNRERGATCLIGDSLWTAFTDTGFDASEERDGIPEAVATVVDGLFDSVMEGIVHRMVMQTLKCVYHTVLERCFALMEDLPAREMAKRGWVCHHGVIKHSELREKAKAREERDCRYQEKRKSTEDSREVSNASGHRSPRKVRSARSSRGMQSQREDSEEGRQRILRQIEIIERRNQQLKKALEQTVSSTPSLRPSEGDRQATLDLDANFEVMSKSLQKRMVAIAAQSVSEETKLTTQHRWKVMKEVELFELVDRLCAMMMNMTPKRFLKSTEFQWAADILARDVMREVRRQVREDARRKERERARRARDADIASRRPSQAGGTWRFRRDSCQPQPRPSQSRGPRGSHRRGEDPDFLPFRDVETSPALLEPLDESKVPLLRLHKRSPHQPPIPLESPTSKVRVTNLPDQPERPERSSMME